jgi:hypothetical protein
MFFKHQAVRFQIVFLLVVFLLASGCASLAQSVAQDDLGLSGARQDNAASATRFDPAASAGIRFSWGNYYDTADGRLVEIETGANPLDPAAIVARRWGPSYQNGVVEAAAQDDGAVAEPTDFIALAGHEDKRWGPGYEDGLVNPAAPAQSDLSFEMDPQAIVGTTWGPSYADTATAPHLSSVETPTATAFQFDLTKLVGVTWGPSYQQ